MYQTLLLISYDIITNINELGQYFISHQCVVDQSISYGSTYHLLFVIPALFIFIIFSILLPLLLILYSIRAFQSCLSRCHLNSIALNIFIEKILGCYRNGLNGGRDMRSFSGLYFFLRIIPYLIVSLLQLLKNNTVTYWYYIWYSFLYRCPHYCTCQALPESLYELLGYSFACTTVSYCLIWIKHVNTNKHVTRVSYRSSAARYSRTRYLSGGTTYHAPSRVAKGPAPVITGAATFSP